MSALAVAVQRQDPGKCNCSVSLEGLQPNLLVKLAPQARAISPLSESSFINLLSNLFQY
jgi:hypothetical protein